MVPLSFASWIYPLIDRVALGGNAKRALALVDKALVKDQDNPQAHALRAEILRQMGRQDDFVAALRDALKADPLYLPARLELGVALAQKGDRAEAQKEMEAVLRQNPLHPRGHFNYGALMSEEGRWEEARLHFARALELDGTYCKSYAALITADLQLGDHAGAVAALEKTRKNCSDPEMVEQAELMVGDGKVPQ
jgi:Tfp pilus assembly protein PilF